METKNRNTETDKATAEALLNEMNAFFETGKTRNLEFRKYMLRKLKTTIKKYEKDVEIALYKDLGKSSADAYISDIGMIYQNIDFFLKNMDKFAKRKIVKRNLSSILSQGYIYKEPYGTVLIVAPFNYP
ncbi:MAG TPA: aldehyde dehydrogenase family protein, partial [Bacteroidales bacterium]|nr:aldehyde dehydrogenase family protein [Bacteroidales bacterium]